MAKRRKKKSFSQGVALRGGAFAAGVGGFSAFAAGQSKVASMKNFRAASKVLKSADSAVMHGFNREADRLYEGVKDLKGLGKINNVQAMDNALLGAAGIGLAGIAVVTLKHSATKERLKAGNKKGTKPKTIGTAPSRPLTNAERSAIAKKSVKKRRRDAHGRLK